MSTILVTGASGFIGGHLTETFSGIQIVRRERMFPRDEADGIVVDRQEEGITTGFADTGLAPNTTYYYTVFTADDGPTPTFTAAASSSIAGFATEDYDFAERLCERRLVDGLRARDGINRLAVALVEQRRGRNVGEVAGINHGDASRPQWRRQ